MIGKIFGISRIRIGVDGPGITTLVGMYRCPLNCEYCINNPIHSYSEYTIEELYNEVKVDSLYFDYTGGGICFGGHEPLLQQSFIIKFIKYIRSLEHTWEFGIETSLNCQIDEELFDCIDYAIVDIKTINPEIYKSYTDTTNKLVLENLKNLNSKVERVVIKIPIIPGYTDEKNVEESKKYLRELGFKDEQFEVFEYMTSLN